MAEGNEETPAPRGIHFDAAIRPVLDIAVAETEKEKPAGVQTKTVQDVDDIERAREIANNDAFHTRKQVCTQMPPRLWTFDLTNSKHYRRVTAASSSSG